MSDDTPGYDTGDSTDEYAEFDQLDAFDQDDELRTLLGDADPSSHLAPADPIWVARLLEDAMSHVIDQRSVDQPADGPELDSEKRDTATVTGPDGGERDTGSPVGPRRTGTRDRSPLTWLVAAAAVVIIAGVGAFGLVNRGSDDVPVAGNDPATSTDPGQDTPSVTAAVSELTAPAAATTGRCAVPTPALLGNQSVAFQATVVSIADGVVTLSPSTVFAGKVATTVEVTAPSADLQALIGAVKFEQGGTYLVSATDGRVSVCGFSGPATPKLQQLYSQAFAG